MSFDLSFIVSAAIALLLGLTIHEFAHAWTANLLGDPTPRWAGRVTLNPLAHLDPVGTVMLALSMFGRAPIGWGKPVPINPAYIRWGRRGVMLTAFAGPLSNILFASSILLILRIISALAPEATLQAMVNSEGLSLLVLNLIYFNVAFAAFNLIPIPPLDGFGVLEGLAPPAWDRLLNLLRQYGMWILGALILIPWFLPELGFNPLGSLYGKMFEGILTLLYSAVGL